jgi:hypothetical protein
MLMVAGDVESKDPPVEIMPECGEDKLFHGANHVCRLAASLSAAYQRIGDASWVFVIDDDAFASTDRIAKVLAQKDASQKVVMGHWGCGKHQCEDGGDAGGNLCGGGGIAISKPALQELVGKDRAAFRAELIREAVGASGKRAAYGDLAISCMLRKRAKFDGNISLEELVGLNPWRLEELGAPYSSSTLPWAYVSQIHENPTPQLTFHYINPSEMPSLKEEFARDGEPFILNALNLTGFTNKALNDNYRLKNGTSWTVSGRETYWSESDEFVIYWCDRYSKWTIAPIYQFNDVYNGSQCVGLASQPESAVPDVQAGWLEMIEVDAWPGKKWIKQPTAGVSDTTLVPVGEAGRSPYIE